jgi:hypothetical protein
MADIFKDIVPSILQTKIDVLDKEQEYVPYIVNKALSYHYDCIFYANMMNTLPNTDKRMQYAFFLNSIRSYKRPFRKWHKHEANDDLTSVMEYYGFSLSKAREALVLLTDSQLSEIKKSLYKGGLTNVEHK